jgi:hypothetical protein
VLSNKDFVRWSSNSILQEHGKMQGWLTLIGSSPLRVWVGSGGCVNMMLLSSKNIDPVSLEPAYSTTVTIERVKE